MNGGGQYYSYTANMVMLPYNIFYNYNFLVRILLFAEVFSRFRITFDTEIDSAINVHPIDGTIIKFNICSGGLYYYDTTNMENKSTKNQVTKYYFLYTVQSNKSYFQIRKIERVGTTIILQQLVGCP